MYKEKIVVSIAAVCSIFAILSCTIIIPSVYNTINKIHDEVIDGVQVRMANFFKLDYPIHL